MGIIRVSQEADVERILSIWLQASIESHDFVEEQFWRSKVNDMRDIYIPSAETYVYEDEEGEVQGFFSLMGNMLAAIFVSPDSQGIGIGKQLMLKAFELRDNLTLTVYTENVDSVLFYERRGFEKVKTQIDENTGRQELIMTWSLYSS